jgi:pimeloyl-ACP methyl ester carboxylesterase
MKRGVGSSSALFTLVLFIGSWGCHSGIAAQLQLVDAGASVPTSTFSSAGPAATGEGVISCSQFSSSLRRGTFPFRSLMQQFSAIYTGANSLSIRYLAVQPSHAATPYPTVVFFNGTSQIAPDWPAQLLVATSSALCNHAALVFFDYPGIGGTAYAGDTAFTFDNVSATVYDLLAALSSSHALKVGVVDPAGWSLGTASAIKFGVLAAHNQSFKASGMSIGSFLLIAANSGGDLHSSTTVTPATCGTIKAGAAAAVGTEPAANGANAANIADIANAALTYFPAIGNQAMCATSVLDQLLVETTYVAGRDIKAEFARLTFPYQFEVPAGQQQSPYGAGNPPTVCATTLSGPAVAALCNLQTATPIESQCAASATSECSNTLALLEANREQSPYLDDIAYDVYFGEREMSFSFAYASCSSASATSWQSTNCQFNPHQTGAPLYRPQLIVDGSPCQTVQTTSANASPTIVGCPGLTGAVKGAKFYVWNGEEDLLIRPDYGQVLCTWLTNHDFPCTYNTFPNAGHAVLFTYATTMYRQLAAAIAASISK